MSMNTTTFTVVRHGQTTHNRIRRFQGQFNSQLDDVGLAQAAAVARRLGACAYDAVYASDLDRTVDTVRAIVGDRPVTFLPALREWHLGEWQDQQIDDIRRRHPDQYAIYAGGSADFAFPGGESHDQLLARVAACFEELAQHHRGQAVLVVAHGGTLRSLLFHAIGVRRLPCSPISHNTSVSRFLHHEGRGWQLELWNDTSHLEAAPGLG
ncbi:MAG: histidine phosphatase family protein [Lentisphaeria bacterium]|nr:histidine phosphatase family protein [Lentisphaeria bacterium]